MPIDATLRLKLPLGQTLGLATLLLVLVFSAVEALVRRDEVQAWLPVPDLKSSSAQFEVKTALLDALMRREGRVDCALIGSSMGETGFDPAAFVDGYFMATGQRIVCFNFSLDGMGIAGANHLAKILTEKYKVKLIIWGTSARDFTIREDEYWSRWHEKVFGPWGLFAGGEYSADGWLLDHSYAYRYSLRLRRFLSDPDYPRTYRQHLSMVNANTLGYEPRIDQDSQIDLDSPPSRENSEDAKNYYDTNEALSMPSIDRIDQLATLNTATHRILLVEMPVHPTYYDYFPSGYEHYQAILAQVRQRAQVGGVPFWGQDVQPAWPRSAWNDRYHLARLGAAAFSQWLGERVGAAVVQGDLALRVP